MNSMNRRILDKSFDSFNHTYLTITTTMMMMMAKSVDHLVIILFGLNVKLACAFDSIKKFSFHNFLFVQVRHITKEPPKNDFSIICANALYIQYTNTKYNNMHAFTLLAFNQSNLSPRARNFLEFRFFLSFLCHYFNRLFTSNKLSIFLENIVYEKSSKTNACSMLLNEKSRLEHNNCV